jgi:hypothetical protein
MSVAHENFIGHHLRRRKHAFQCFGCRPVSRSAAPVEKSATGEEECRSAFSRPAIASTRATVTGTDGEIPVDVIILPSAT